jgi:hypothetical protein
MIAAAVDLAAAERPAVVPARDPHTVGQHGMLDAERLQAGAHRRDAIALLDAQLLGARDQRLAACAGRRR